MSVYNKRGILLLPKVIVLNPKDGFCNVILGFTETGLLSFFAEDPFLCIINGEKTRRRNLPWPKNPTATPGDAL